MALNQPFTTASQAIASYNYTDIREGVGYQDYYLIESETSGGKDYHLTPRTDYSNSATKTSTGALDIDYDLSPFVLPQRMDGTALISLAVHGTSSANPTFTVELYKWDGATETQIGSTVTYAPTLTAARMLYFPITLSNVNFAVGESLRLRVAQTATGVSTGWGQDPAGRTDGSFTITTTSKLSIPFKLDL